MRTLDGVRVLDLSRFLAGPLCGLLLADNGAEVIRIEPPSGGEDRRWALIGPDGENLPFKIFARSKKGISLSLKTEGGKELFAKLVKQADVVIHNTPPGTKLAEVLAYPRLREINPSIIVGMVSGYGWDGPKADNVGLDFAIQAGVGSMALNGFSEGPPMKTTVPYIDCCSGTACALGILMALYHREKTGVGQAIDTSLFDIGCFITQAVGALLLYGVYNEKRERLGNFGFSTYMSCLQAKDGMVMVVPSTDPMWSRFARAIEREDLINNHLCRNDMERWKNSTFIDGIVQVWASNRTVNEIISILRHARVACERVNRPDELLNDPQVVAREMITWVDYPGIGHIPFPGLPLKFSHTPGRITALAPRIGEHNEEIYKGLLGLSEEEIERLHSEGTI